MNKLYLLLLLGAASVTGASAQSKFDAGGRMILGQYANYQLNPAQAIPASDVIQMDFEKLSRSGGKVAIFVGLNDGHSADELEAYGFEVGVDGGSVALVRGTMEAIAALEECDFVKSVSFGNMQDIKLDLARTATGVDIIHAGTEIGTAYKGKGVLAGIFDLGIDPNHANFRNDDGSTRIASLWQYSGTPNIAEGESPTVTQYSTPEEISEFTSDNRMQSHGTHTTGCMAGSFNKRGGGAVAIATSTGGTQAGARFVNPYYGMAPEATIAIGCGPLADANIYDGVQRIINYAKAHDMPCVVNLSVGSTIGPHDGKDLSSQLLSNMGRDAIICVAAGNEGDVPMSITKTFTASDNSFTTVFAGNGGGGSGIIDIYSNDATPFTTDLIVYDTTTGADVYKCTIAPGESNGALVTNNFNGDGYVKNSEFDKAFTQSYVQWASSFNPGTNNRYSMRLGAELSVNRITNTNANLVLAIRVTGANGQLIHMTHNSTTAEFTNMGNPALTDGSGSFSISSMACADNILVVGAWNTRKKVPCLGKNNSGSWYTYTDAGMEVDSIAGYSSWGVLADGRQLPHVCAPGTGIISSISMYYYNNATVQVDTYDQQISANQTANGRPNQWEAMQGTSMATPVVAGSIALWLQYKPDLTINEVKNIIASTSTRDAYVTGAPYPVQWGAGKFNALAGLKELIKNNGGIEDVAAGTADNIVARYLGADNWEILVPGAPVVDIALYNTQGQIVATATGSDCSASISTAGLAKGIYILTANGRHSTRVVVR
ncbi:MAG: S8 family peptidase [Odoribacter sp.]|nr:S8 family peptidase [Odoribacter sp.]